MNKNIFGKVSNFFIFHQRFGTLVTDLTQVKVVANLRT